MKASLDACDARDACDAPRVRQAVKCVLQMMLGCSASERCRDS